MILLEVIESPEPDEIRIGMPIEVVFAEVDPEATLPKFRVAG